MNLYTGKKTQFFGHTCIRKHRVNQVYLSIATALQVSGFQIKWINFTKEQFYKSTVANPQTHPPWTFVIQWIILVHNVPDRGNRKMLTEHFKANTYVVALN